MNQLIKKMSIAMAVITLITSCIFMTPNQVAAESNLDIDANAAIAIEESTGKILYQKNSEQLMGIASMTKMMVEAILLEKIKTNKLKWDDKVKISDYAHQISQDRSLSNVPLRKDETYTVRELYEAMAIYSANGATISLAEHLAGSEEKFVALMNEKAKELRLDKYEFVNSTGLNNADLRGKHQVGGEKDENKMTAREMAKLAKYLIDHHPEVLKTASITKKDFRPGTSDKIAMSNWNWLLPGLIYGRKGVDGLKTGTTDYAGMCLTATAKQGDMRVVTVVLHANGGKGGQHNDARFVQTNKMLDYAFNNYKLKNVQKADVKAKNPDSIKVSKGKEGQVGLEADKDVKLVVPKTMEKVNLKTKINLNKKSLDAPTKKGAQVGTMSIALKEGDNLGYIDGKQTETIPVVTSNEVEKENWFGLSVKSIGSFFVGIGNYIMNGISGWFS